MSASNVLTRNIESAKKRFQAGIQTYPILDFGFWILDFIQSAFRIPHSAIAFTVTRSCENFTRLTLLRRFLKKRHLNALIKKDHTNELQIITPLGGKVNMVTLVRTICDSGWLKLESNKLCVLVSNVKPPAMAGGSDITFSP